MDKIKKALNIASRDLRACYGRQGIYAGLHHFKNYWARDSSFASLGSLELEDYEIVKNNLILYLNNITKFGQLPFRVGPNMVLNYFGLDKKRTPRYHNDKGDKKTIDQNSLLIISFYNYIKKTNDFEFLKKYIHRIESALMWNFKCDINKDLLLEEHEYCNWADSIKKKGSVLFTNVCHCHAVCCVSKLFKQLNNKTKQQKYLEIHKKIKDKINHDFWSGEHYIDWIDNKKQYNYFSTDGNILAIIWDIASQDKAKHIEEASHIFDINEIPSQCVHPNYPNKYISTKMQFMGLGDYHNGLSWLWLGCINALAKDKIGMKKESVLLLEKISDIIIKFDSVYEVYDKTGKPVNRLIYKSEHPFAWSAGLFVYVVSKIMN